MCSLANYPNWEKRNGTVSNQYSAVMDIMPTIWDSAGIPHTGSQCKGKPIENMVGESWRDYMTDE